MELVTDPWITVVGEGMLELSCAGKECRLGYGGDTLNTAVHLARIGLPTAFLTALGDEPFGQDMCAEWQAEGLDCSRVLVHPHRTTGLYAISTDERGERSFTYWREASAAREMTSLGGWEEACRASAGSDLLYFSLITLAILPAAGRERLLALARSVRNGGGRVAFDGNYRTRLWRDPADAAAARDAAIACADIGLPTLADERELGGVASADDVAAHWRALGCKEVVVKLGPDGCLLPDGSQSRPDRNLEPVDTSGAGDAFNAGYLAARLCGAAPGEAARRGHALAGWTIMRRGAIPPKDAAAPYDGDASIRAIGPDPA